MQLPRLYESDSSFSIVGIVLVIALCATRDSHLRRVCPATVSTIAGLYCWSSSLFTNKTTPTKTKTVSAPFFFTVFRPLPSLF